MTKPPKPESTAKHVYLKDRVDSWSGGVELALYAGAVGVALLVAIYSPAGFWNGLLEALKQFFNQV